MRVPQIATGPVSRKKSIADRQLVQFEAGHRPKSPSVSGTGKTANEYLAASGGQASNPRSGLNSVQRIASDDEFVSSVLRNVELSFVVSGPAYRAKPKDALLGVFQNVQRAARASKVSRFVQRLAP